MTRQARAKTNPTLPPGTHEILDEVAATKRLMILLLAKLGARSDEIAMALGGDSSGVRKMMSFRKVTRAVIQSTTEE